MLYGTDLARWLSAVLVATGLGFVSATAASAAAITHLISYWTRIFPNHFELVPVSGAERFFLKIAFGRVRD